MHSHAESSPEILPQFVYLNDWLADDLMQKIAMENNLAETAFIVPEGKEWLIRWFTPVTEVDLCGHGTLASSFVVMDILEPDKAGSDISYHAYG